jgi:hypothetical protein
MHRTIAIAVALTTALGLAAPAAAHDSSDDMCHSRDQIEEICNDTGELDDVVGSCESGIGAVVAGLDVCVERPAPPCRNVDECVDAVFYAISQMVDMVCAPDQPHCE